MCGIAGIIGNDSDRLVAAAAAMTAAQLHRGPDDAGAALAPFGRGFLALGQRRLSILDLSPAGHQPMVHPETGNLLVFNGEIYNWKVLRAELAAQGDHFRGHSDTEVLLHALTRWGTGCLSRLQGMYAFAFFEPTRHRLILARDPLGIKPLYTAQCGGRFLFASEVRALLASQLVPRRLDRQALAGYLAYGGVQQPRTMLCDVSSVAPGTWQEVRPQDDDTWQAGTAERFWHYPDIDAAITEVETLDRVRSTLTRSVQDHLVADVPVGVFLSSGIDSTILAGLAAEQTRSLRSFTVGFAEQADFNELRLAGETAQRFGLKHQEILLTDEQARADFTDWLTRLDQPSMDGFNVYLIAKAVRACGIKVALSGLGGDELFCGYPSFRDVPRLLRALRWLQPVPRAVRRTLAIAVAMRRPRAVRRKLRDMMGGDGSLLSLYLQRRRVMADEQMASLGVSDELSTGVIDQLRLDDADPIAALARLESHYYQGNILLPDADVNGMAHGLEIRVPMLDQRLVELAHAVPGAVRLPVESPGKQVLRQAFARFLTPELRTQPKRGFLLPIRRWMASVLRPLCEQNLAATRGILTPSGVDGVWQDFLAEPEGPAWSRAFTLCVLGHYLRTAGL